jgi:hypothetical protein
VCLTSRDEGLFEPGADGLAAGEMEAVFYGEDAFGLGRAEPLEVFVQLRAFEIILLLGPVGCVVAGGGEVDIERGYGSVLDVQPVVVAPVGFLDGGFAAQDAAPGLGSGAAGEVDEVCFAVGSVDDVAVACALEGSEGRVFGGENVFLGMELVGTPDVA